MNAISSAAASLDGIVALARYPLADPALAADCRARFDRDGVLVLPGFITAAAVNQVRAEGERSQHKAYYCSQRHNVYLTPPDPAYSASHVRNLTLSSSKGCITDDCIGADSPLRRLYDAPVFRAFLCGVLDEQALYPYADALSSINLHYAAAGQELGWHFDNSAFAITLLIQQPAGGGAFEYVSAARDAAAGEMGFTRVQQVLDGAVAPQRLAMAPGSLVLFRGRDALHRVTPVTGDVTRMLVVLAYNAEPGVALSESARMTFYGRLA